MNTTQIDALKKLPYTLKCAYVAAYAGSTSIHKRLVHNYDSSECSFDAASDFLENFLLNRDYGHRILVFWFSHAPHPKRGGFTVKYQTPPRVDISLGIIKQRYAALKNYDERGVRAFVRYSVSTGKFAIECYRKKTKEDSQGCGDWKMIRVGHVTSYDTRLESEQKALELAESICKEFNY